MIRIYNNERSCECQKLIFPIHALTPCRRSGSLSSFILNIGTRLRWLGDLATRSLHLRGRKAQHPLKGGFLGVRAGLDALKTRKIISSDGIQTPDRLAHRLDIILTMRSQLYVGREVYPLCNTGVSNVTPCLLLVPSLRSTLLRHRLSILSSLPFVFDTKCYSLSSSRYMTLW